MFDPRLKAIVVKLLDVSYGGDNGFNQAIDMSADTLQNVKFIAEKKLLTAFFTVFAIPALGAFPKLSFGFSGTECPSEGLVAVGVSAEGFSVGVPFFFASNFAFSSGVTGLRFPFSFLNSASPSFLEE